jgi:hypothetical protein
LLPNRFHVDVRAHKKWHGNEEVNNTANKVEKGFIVGKREEAKNLFSEH